MKRIAALALLTMSTGAALALAAGPASAAGHHHGYDGYDGYCGDRQDSAVLSQGHHHDCDRGYGPYTAAHTLPLVDAAGHGYYEYH
ncbi:hypothetical protein [Nocardiopsis sp. NRRL B-16309]|uniref:hypothetical protein n=1 Tax=Nocardiopsis sp. NRRL B-16309 TaxID=1519494 RepID=UPI0006AEFB8C|nr:hypothetical protein [Nocardiopsis sp. NRRL B-16309]KOX17742.1 hypothetical protein ADL05_09010 [Nocardiopsis sp. NRRL B-16309]